MILELFLMFYYVGNVLFLNKMPDAYVQKEKWDEKESICQHTCAIEFFG